MMPLAVRISVFWLALMLGVALLAGVLMPYGYTALDLRHRLAPPVLFGGSTAHWLVTD